MVGVRRRCSAFLVDDATFNHVKQRKQCLETDSGLSELRSRRKERTNVGAFQ